MSTTQEGTLRVRKFRKMETMLKFMEWAQLSPSQVQISSYPTGGSLQYRGGKNYDARIHVVHQVVYDTRDVKPLDPESKDPTLDLGHTRRRRTG